MSDTDDIEYLLVKATRIRDEILAKIVSDDPGNLRDVTVDQVLLALLLRNRGGV